MVVDRSNVDHIMRGLQSTEGVRLHNHRKKLRQRFDIIKKLGQGTYGKVQLGINKETGQEVAIKTIKKCKIETEADLVRIRREIQIMSSVRHPNIIHIYEVFENREKIVLVMEYAAGGELYDYLSERKVLEETEARRIFRQISTAIYYCHKHKICHRDLKLENILLDEHGSAKIADFGLSNVFDGQRLLSTYCGSPLYASPEIVKGTPYHGPEVDCWSLGVLLYTLVYGAMPFDGSNFKRLVKQISQGDYFEPKKASPASPLIRDMLTVNSPDRATIEQICSHWWVNQGFNVSCLDIAEDLANQTPVRLDLLLSLAPPPENTEKIVVTDDQANVPQEAPPRSMSVGSFMELDANAEERVRSFVAREVPLDNTTNEKTMKRKLEPVPSKSFSGARKKERMKPETEEKEEPIVTETEPSANKPESNNVVMDVDTETNKSSEKVEESNSANVEKQEQLEKPSEVPVAQFEKVDKSEPTKAEVEKPTESISKDKPTRKSVKVVKKKVTEKKDSEVEKKEEVESADAKAKVKKKKTDSPSPGESEPSKEVVKEEKSQEKEEVSKEVKKDGVQTKTVKQNEREEKEKTPRSEESPSKPVERRKSKIFETAEKFMTNDQKSPTQEKPKKVYIPGVKVSDFAKAFERRSSVPTTPLKSSPSRKTIVKDTAATDKKSEERKSPEKKSISPEAKKENNDSSQINKTQKEIVEEPKPVEEISKVEAKEEPGDQKAEEERQQTPVSDEKLKKVKDALKNVLSNAMAEEERKKVKKQILKPPVPKTKTEDLDNRKKSLTLQIGKETATVQVHTPENTKFLFEPEGETPAGENKENIEKPKEKKTAKVEITLKSNTLPRRTSKAEVRLVSPQMKKDVGNVRTEIEHRVGDPSHVYSTQRSEVAFPVSAAPKPIRSMSLEPEARPKSWQSRERIIPIQVEGGHKDESEARDRVKELDRPHEGRQKLPYQRTLSLRSNSLSRQSTQDSDTESTMSTTGEPIKKSPREFIIPIAVEGGGYVTPRATSLEPSESMSSKRSHRPFSRKFSLWSDNGSEDESPFSTLQRHSSRDVDDTFRLHRLRSSRPTRPSVEKTDSASGSEEEEDDDGFELLTAENLFSTLLSRVRSLTQRLNVEDGIRPGFPSSRLLSNHFGPSERLFSNFHQPLTRFPDRSEFGRSLSRDIENGSNRWSRSELRNSDSNRSLPRGNSKSKRSDSDTESMSENSSKSSKPRKQKSEGEKKERKSRNHSKTHSGPVTLTENEEITEYVPTFDGNKSLYVPSRMWTARAHEKRSSEGDATPTAYRSGIPKLLRPTSLLLEKVRNDSEDREETSESGRELDEPREKDFYDILAEKYGITNVTRYDLPKERRTPFDRSKYLLEGRRSCIPTIEKDVEPPKNKKEEKEEKENVSNVAASKTPKEEPLQEKCKTPSEKLAAVLNRLEKKSSKKESTPAEKKAEDGSLPTLSPAALELYEKTLAEYRKSKKSEEVQKPEVKRNSVKSKIPQKITARHQSDMSIKEFEKIQENRKSENKSKTPERSVLTKYWRHSSVENKESEEKVEKNKEEDTATESNKNSKGKFLTSLEKKLEKIRTTSEKKYVDRAIRSLRESSLGPKDVSSENVLIKRAVSLSDCPSYRSGQTGKVQSTVSSVLGMFKKFENSDTKKIKPSEPEKDETSKIPVLRKPEVTTTITEPPKFRPTEPIQVTSMYTRRPSYFTGNGFSFLNSNYHGMEDSSLLTPDADSYDSWSNCSDLGNPDDVFSGRNYSPLSKYSNVDDLSKESVSDRIRRKSFYTRFNERKKPRRSSLLVGRTNYDEAEGGEGRLTYNRSSSHLADSVTRPSYNRSVSSGDEYTKRYYEEGRPRPFYKTSDGPTPRKNNYDWSRTAGNSSYLRSSSQSPSAYSSFTLPRNFSTFDRSYRMSSLYGSTSSDIDRPFSPTRPYSSRPVSPNFPYPTSQSPNNVE